MRDGNPGQGPNPTECPSKYDDSYEGEGNGGGQLIRIHVGDVNDPPFFKDNSVCTSSQTPCMIDNLTKTIMCTTPNDYRASQGMPA